MIAHVGRFILRDIDPWEGPRVFRLTGDPKVTRYLGFRTHTSVEQATAMIVTYKDSPSRWLAICTEDDPMLGIVGFEVRGHQATITMMLRSDWKTRGIGREFGHLFVEWVFTHPQIWRMWSYVHVDNVAGQHVTERTGALREGRLRRFEVFPNISDEPQDVYVYAIVRGSTVSNGERS